MDCCAIFLDGTWLSTAPDIERLLSHLAVEGKVAADTQKQAFNALIFLYHKARHNFPVCRRRTQ
jgi:hypothetical protein